MMNGETLGVGVGVGVGASCSFFLFGKKKIVSGCSWSVSLLRFCRQLKKYFMLFFLNLDLFQPLLDFFYFSKTNSQMIDKLT